MKNLILLILVFNLSCSSIVEKGANAPLVDVVLLGAGIMSATTGTMLKLLDPKLSMEIFESLPEAGMESSAALNNAGTGHAAFAELNYTPENKNGEIEISKALKINEHFMLSKQFWSHLVKLGLLKPKTFINPVPHISFVWGDENVAFLRKRAKAMKASHQFADMEYSEDHKEISRWIPLVMKDRNPQQKIAATKIDRGTDVNFGALTKALIAGLQKTSGVKISFNSQALDLKRSPSDQSWIIKIKDLENNKEKFIRAKFVFIGAGGAALTLLQKSGIEEGRGYAGFPVGGQWLITTNPKIVNQHQAKVYGKASVGSPPMSVPHLDTRMIDGKKALLFGPFATFSTKFLKNGSWLDMFLALNLSNIWPMMQAGLNNFDLTKYLIGQLLLSKDERLDALKEYFPQANDEDWYLSNAGQRVQIIKKDPEKGGILQFGTELVGSKDGSIMALLGASPGASVSVRIALRVIKRSFNQRLLEDDWQNKITKMIPSYGQKLRENPVLFFEIEKNVNEVLELKNP